MLSLYDWIYGTAEASAGILSIIAAFIAISMFRAAGKTKKLRAWRYLLIGLLFFSAVELAGAIKTFGIFSTPYLTHVLVSFVLVFLIAALVIQININRGWME